ncbi:MAG: ROK family protein [Acidimicrobiales bacterium]
MSLAAGIDAGGTKLLGVVLSATGEAVCELRREITGGGRLLLEEIAGMTLLLHDAAGPGAGATMTLGVGVAGLVDRNGVLQMSPNLPMAGGTAVLARLADDARLGGVVEHIAVDNDASCAGLGECSYGAARDQSDVLFVTLGTGIGGAMISGGRRVAGANNFAGEIGHMVIDRDGLACGCGRRGCWELYASGSALGRLGREAAAAGRASAVLELAGGDAELVRGEHVVLASEQGDSEAASLLAELAWWLGLGLVNLINVLDPELVVLGGGLVRAGEALLAPARAAVLGHLPAASERPPVEIVSGALGDRAGAIGAAVMARCGRHDSPVSPKAEP